jgi:hypothetical protein
MKIPLPYRERIREGETKYVCATEDTTTFLITLSNGVFEDRLLGHRLWLCKVSRFKSL